MAESDDGLCEALAKTVTLDRRNVRDATNAAFLRTWPASMQRFTRKLSGKKERGKMRILVIAPHLMTSRLAVEARLFARATWRCRERCFPTSGELGLKQLPREQAWNIREAEERSACKILGISEPQFLRLPDWTMGTTSLAPVQARGAPGADRAGIDLSSASERMASRSSRFASDSAFRARIVRRAPASGARLMKCGRPRRVFPRREHHRCDDAKVYARCGSTPRR